MKLRKILPHWPALPFKVEEINANIAAPGNFPEASVVGDSGRSPGS
jgi:hypothetical protein